jgi:hypothetical protein
MNPVFLVDEPISEQKNGVQGEGLKKVDGANIYSDNVTLYSFRYLYVSECGVVASSESNKASCTYIQIYAGPSKYNLQRDIQKKCDSWGRSDSHIFL